MPEMESSSPRPLVKDDAQARRSPVQEPPVEPLGPEASGSPAETAATDSAEARPAPDAAEADDASKLRRNALAPHFEGFLRWASGEVHPQDVPHFTELGGRPIELGAWERTVLMQAWEGGGNQRAACLLGEGVALQAKCLDLMDLFEHGPMPPPAELPEFLERLVTVLAVGIALQEELQWDIDRMIGSSRLADAKSLSRFRAKVVQSWSSLKERVGPNEIEQAEQRAESMVSVEPEEEPDPFESAPPARLAEQEPELPRWASYGKEEGPGTKLPPWLSEGQDQEEAAPEPSVKVAPRNWTKPLVIVLAALIVIYAAVMLPRLTRSAPVVLSIEQFSHLEAVDGIVARPPSLFVVLDGQQWEASTPEQRQALLQEIGRIAAEADYHGVHARTGDGVTVGQWLEKTGVRLLQRPLAAS